MMKVGNLVCMIGSIPQEERPRYDKLRDEIIKRIDHLKTVEHHDGFTFSFQPDPGIVRKLGDWLTYEQACCPFFRFDLAIEPEHGPITLKISGIEGVKEFLSELV